MLSFVWFELFKHYIELAQLVCLLALYSGRSVAEFKLA
jgi:hypothetical protein